LKRYARSPARIFGSLGQPLLFLFALGFGFGPVFSRAGYGDYIQYLVPGVVTMSILFSALLSGVEVLWDRQFGFLKETLVAPVPRFVIVVGRTLGAATVAVIQGLVVMLVCLAIGFRLGAWTQFPLALVTMLLIGIVFCAVGTLIGSLIHDMQAFPVIVNFLVFPLFFFSGALFPTIDLPSWLFGVVALNPLTYGVDALREALTGTVSMVTARDFGVLVGMAAASLAAAALSFARLEV
jgi:ABC-2 type transport system permease protein